jgi:hypothetical protein
METCPLVEIDRSKGDGKNSCHGGLWSGSLPFLTTVICSVVQGKCVLNGCSCADWILKQMVHASVTLPSPGKPSRSITPSLGYNFQDARPQRPSARRRDWAAHISSSSNCVGIPPSLPPFLSLFRSLSPVCCANRTDTQVNPSISSSWTLSRR